MKVKVNWNMDFDGYGQQEPPRIVNVPDTVLDIEEWLIETYECDVKSYEYA